MHRPVIIDAVRTPIGRFQGGLSHVRPDDLGAHVIRELLVRTGADGAAVDEVFFGCANQAGEDNRNVARMALLLAELPQHVPGVTVNRLCASGLEAVNQGSRMIQVGDAQLVVAGGVESMSRAPYSVPRGPQHPKAGNLTVWDTSLGWRYPNPRLSERFPLEAMGCTAENIVDELQISRADQDAFALRSHQKALAAWKHGWFDPEVVPVSVKLRKQTLTVDRDEGPRAETSLDKLASLRAAFREGGSVTAGNSSTLNDGAAALLLASSDYAAERGLEPRARVLACASAGVDPTVMGYGPVPASQKALKRAGLEIDDIDVWELNEAFAAQSLGVIRKLGLDEARVNLHGGAIALGHPLGCSGARILTTLLNVMDRVDARYGVATLCVGVGQGVATVIERLKMNQIGVIGAGTMGHGIAQVCAMAGYRVVLTDRDREALDRGLGALRATLDKGVDRGKVDASVRERALQNLHSTPSLAEAAEAADLLVEAIPERLDWKQDLFRELETLAGPSCVFATNTSSLSVARIASVLQDPGRVIGTHFFNPVHIMKLLEVVVHDATRDDVLGQIKGLGARIGKEVIVVKDFPGFATSRLGVCLGMEAIRMVEQGVASPEDIDKAMVLGYRHPIGPLKLTDLVGLDVRLNIGEYLSRELNNPAFEPPALMRQMVEAGQLGKKSGQGFYSWD